MSAHSNKSVNQKLKENAALASDKVSDTAQRLKPEDQKSLGEKAREKATDTWEATKEKAHDVGKQMGLTSDSSYKSYAPYEKTTGEKLKESGARVSDKVSDTAQRLKPEDQKSLGEKTREKATDTWEATKEKAHDIGYQMGLTSDSTLRDTKIYDPYEKTTGEKLKESGARVSDKVSDTAQRLKPEEEKSVLEKAREKVHDTFEAAKEKVHDVGKQMGLTSDSTYSKKLVSL